MSLTGFEPTWFSVPSHLVVLIIVHTLNDIYFSCLNYTLSKGVTSVVGSDSHKANFRFPRSKTLAKWLRVFSYRHASK
jgi:hypothetical protein